MSRRSHNLGNALKTQGRLEEAAANYRMALVLQPDCAEAIFQLGNVFLAQKKQEEAIACFRQALSLRSDKPEILAAANDCLAIALGEQGKSSEVLACFKQAPRVQPTAWRRISMAVHLPVIYQSQGDLHTCEIVWFRKSACSANKKSFTTWSTNRRRSCSIWLIKASTTATSRASLPSCSACRRRRLVRVLGPPLPSQGKSA